MGTIRSDVRRTGWRGVTNVFRRLKIGHLRIWGLCAVVLVCVMYIASVATADVDTRGELREISSSFKSSPGEVSPLTITENEDYECIAEYSDIQSQAFDWVIGNCPKGAVLEAVIRELHNDSEPEGDYSLGGWVGGAFQGCGWIEDERFKPKAKKSKPTTACSELTTGEHKIQSEFMETHNKGTGDGYYVVNATPCPEYANYRPWSKTNVEKELIRTAPAYAVSGSGSNYPALKWRYTTKYNSTDGTGQYVMVRDDRFSDGEGNWVFIPRSCLPTTLPENENERVPSPPAVTTNAASEVTVTQATLNGIVNPNGIEATYHFEYGTSTTYGTPTGPGDAGTGKVNEPETAMISHLSPGTTYHYRIVATSDTGTSVGSDQTFTTDGPVEAVTGLATGVQPLQATLNGTVNPRGYDAKYYFQYWRTTEHIESTSEGDAGSGTSPGPVSDTVSSLAPCATYYYRLVSFSGGITSYGSDRTFTTTGSCSSTALRESSTGAQWIFYRGTDGAMWEWYLASSNSTSWVHIRLGGAVAAGTSPSVVRNASTGAMWVHYVGSEGEVWELWSGNNGVSWSDSVLGGQVAAGTHPVTVRDSSTGDMWVFYVGGDGAVYQWMWNGSVWADTRITSTGAVAAGTSPSVEREAASGKMWVHYVGSEGQVWELWSGNNGETWPSDTRLGGEAGTGTSPVTVRNPTTGEMWIYYVGNNLSIGQLMWNGSTWANTNL